MKHFATVAVLFVAVAALLLSGCTIQLLEAPEAQVPEEMTVGLSERAMEAGDAPDIFLATDVNYVVGEWFCDQHDGPGIIRLDPDGRMIRVLGPGDAVDIGYFWFKDGDFHVMSDVDGAAHMSVFHAIVETSGEGTFLRLEPCGGDCVDTASIEWLQGLERVEPSS